MIMKDARFLIVVFVTAIAQQVPSISFSQNQAHINLKKLIILDSNPIRFDSLVSTISKQAKVQFSFNTGKITPEKKFVMKQGEQTLKEVLVQIKRMTGIYYKIVGSHIILLDKRPETRPSVQSKTTSQPSINSSRARVNQMPGKLVVKKAVSNHPGSSNTNKPVEPAPQIDNLVAGSTITSTDYLPVAAETKDTITGLIAQIKTVKENSNQGINSRIDSVQQSPPGTINTSELIEIGKTATLGNSYSGVKTNKQSRNNKLSTSSKANGLQLFAGIELSRTTNIKDEENDNLMGGGVNLKVEKGITKKISATASFGILHFSGLYTSVFNPFRSNGKNTIKNFTLSPLLAGIRYRLVGVMYLSTEAGITFRNKANDRLLLVLAPSAGVLLPVKENKKIDLGLKFSHTVARPSFLGDPILQTGGYSFLSFRCAYGF